MKQKIKLLPGVKYKGYAFVNEFGEINFTPEETGAHEGQMKLVVNGDNYTVNQTKKYIIFRFRLNTKDNIKARMRGLLDIMNQFITIVRTYDF